LLDALIPFRRALTPDSWWDPPSDGPHATCHQDLLREDELVVFRALLPRLGAPEAGCGLFAVVAAVRDDGLLGVDFFTAAPGRLDDVAPGAGRLAGPLDVALGAAPPVWALDAVSSGGLELAFDAVSLAASSDDFCFER
jgi:hypothetical protein